METEIAEVKEKVKTDILGVQASNQTTQISKVDFYNILNKYFVDIPENYTLDTEITTKSEYGNHKIKITDLYNGTLTEKIITNFDIENAKNKSQYYGAVVKGYELPTTTQTDVGWKILYADNSNIYLIADNYIERENLPNSTTENGEFTERRPDYGSSDYPRAAYLSSIIVDYIGSERIKDDKLKLLNNDFFNEKKYISTNNNMKKVAYMMDTTAWNSKFKDVNNKAEYVIGAPTIEMLMKSYSQKYGVDYQARTKDILGYELSVDGGKNWANTLTKCFNTEDSLYVINSQVDAKSMWVASPAATFSHLNVVVSNEGDITPNDAIWPNESRGFRPVIALKSDVKLQQNIDGSYSIK